MLCSSDGCRGSVWRSVAMLCTRVVDLEDVDLEDALDAETGIDWNTKASDGNAKTLDAVSKHSKLGTKQRGRAYITHADIYMHA